MKMNRKNFAVNYLKKSLILKKMKIKIAANLTKSKYILYKFILQFIYFSCYFQSQLQEQTETISELQSRLQTSTLDHDRRLTSIQQTHEEEKQLLFGQLQESANQMKELERDLYFYKHKTRELRKSMATSTTSVHDSSTTGIARRKESNSNEDEFLTQLPTPRTAVQQQQSAPFLLKIGNRSASANQTQQDEIKKR
jgi:hypothetical protein